MEAAEREALAARVIDALTILVFGWFVLACLHGIASPWQWGHNGFNGAAFAQAARNTLRFHVLGQALYYTGLKPPEPGTLYTHHPQMLHWHLIALFKVLGAKPWVGRLIPATYSVLTLVLVHRIALRWWDRVTALVAIALYAFTPLHVIFANMIDHEQGSIFWTLLAVWAYVRLREEDSRKYFVVCLVAISFAAQFDWPPYYIAFFLAVHSLVMGLRKGGPVLAWRREWTFLVVFSAVVLLNFGAFFAWIYAQRGTLSEMGQAYTHRTTAAQGYVAVQYQRLIDLYGPVLIWLTLLWVPLVVVRLRKGEAKERDLVPACFFGAQVIHSVVFRNAGNIHSYWTYWLGVATALGGADVAVTAFRVLRAWIEGRPRARVGRIALVVTAFTLVLFQVQYAYARMKWGFRNGSAGYVSPTPDIRAEVRMAQFLAQRFAREDTLYLFHSSVPALIQVHWYHDTPFEQRTVLAPTSTDYVRAKHLVVIADARSVGERALLWKLVREHPTLVFDRRLVAIDMSIDGEHLEAFRTQVRPPLTTGAAIESWFVDPARPPAGWVQDDVAATKVALDWGGELDSVLESSTRGGLAHGWDCPRGERMVGLVVTPSDKPPTVVARVRGRCAKPGGGEDGEETPVFGGPTTSPEHEAQCPADTPMVGVVARTGRYLDAVSPICGTSNGETVLPPGGGAGGVPMRLVCPQGTVVRGLRVRSGALVDGIGVACGRL